MVIFERGGRGCHGNHDMRHAMRHGGFGGRGFGGGGFSVRWGGDDDGRGGGRGAGRGRRMFDSGELRLVLLKLIAEQPRHGYDLIREIETRTQGAYAPSPGVIYPTITMLDDMGMIEEQKADGAKKQFAITAAGQALLTEREVEVEALFARLAEVGAERQRTDGGPIRRAMGNLRQVLHQRLATEDDADTLHQVAALLDEVAQKIERLK
ncbi:PadR family transcriptional regulator [Sphingomonas endolithica]|uniref:PadR family transcriptional regulator n=1 Tax=Sphingomonas endolithica TaxID=2972485 RepID=UPI003AAEEAD0